MKRIRWCVWRYSLAVRDYVRYRLVLRNVSRLKRRVGVAVVQGGTDCDGMRWANCAYFWTKEGAQEYLELSFADGPMNGHVVSARAGRDWEASYVPDNRARFAERMGY